MLIPALMVLVGLASMAPVGASRPHAGTPTLPSIPGGTGNEEESSTTEGESTTSRPADNPDAGEAPSPATTKAGEAEGVPSSAEDDDDGRTAAIAIAALAGLFIGMVVAGIPLALALSRRKARSVPTPAQVIPAPPAPAGAPAAATSPPEDAFGPATTPFAVGPIVAPAPVAPGGPVIGPAPSRDEDKVRSERATLVEAFIALRDQLPSAALGDEAARALAGVGVVEVRPDGQPFDPTRHRAVEQVRTDDPARHNTVASTERVGYADGDRLIRLPDVVVARQDGQP